MDVTVEFQRGKSEAWVRSAHTMAGSAKIVVLTDVSLLKSFFVVVARPSLIFKLAC
jgi:hypothetical protein